MTEEGRFAEFQRKAEALAQLRADYDVYQKNKTLPRDMLPLTVKDAQFLKDCGIATT